MKKGESERGIIYYHPTLHWSSSSRSRGPIRPSNHPHPMGGFVRAKMSDLHGIDLDDLTNRLCARARLTSFSVDARRMDGSGMGCKPHARLAGSRAV